MERGKLDPAAARLLEYLSAEPDAHKLVLDEPDGRWFAYGFEADPPEVSDVRKDIAVDLLAAGWIEDRGKETRVDFPGDDYRVFLITEAGKRALSEARG
jgi:hypothetical protein